MQHMHQQALTRAARNAAQRGFADDLDTGVAAELGVPLEAYRAYRQVARAIDRYQERPLDPDTAGPGPTRCQQALESARQAAGRVVDAATALHRSWTASKGWHPDAVSEHARRILGGALTVKAQLDHLNPTSLVLASQLNPEEVDGLAR